MKRPVYSGIEFSDSVYTSYVFEHNRHIFTAEAGTRFFLKLHLAANPWPGSCNLYRNGQLLRRSPLGTIQLCVDSVNIQAVQPSDDGAYTISSSNLFGEGRFSFQLRGIIELNYDLLQLLL